MIRYVFDKLFSYTYKEVDGMIFAIDSRINYFEVPEKETRDGVKYECPKCKYWCLV